MKRVKKEFWYCIIGPIDQATIPDGGDLPMRLAVSNKFQQMFNSEPIFLSSGWGVTSKIKELLLKVLLSH